MKVDVLGELHLYMLMRLGVHEQHAVLARLLNHAHMQIALLRQFLGRLCVSVDHAGEEGLRVVAVVARYEVYRPRGGDRCQGEPEASLYAD
jgi:hypothetical protein